MNRLFLFSALLLALSAWLVAGAAAQTSAPDFTGLEAARDATGGPASGLTTASIRIGATGSSASVPAGDSMRFGMSDESQTVGARLPNGIVLMLSRTKATFGMSGTLPVRADVSVDAEAHAEARGRLRINSQQIVQEAIDGLGEIPAIPGGYDSGDVVSAIPSGWQERRASARADGSFHAEGSIDNVQASAEIGKETRGVLVGVPVTGGLSFFAGAKQVQEYVVVAVQGFDYRYAYEGRVSGSVTDETGGRSRSGEESWSGSGGGRVATPWARGRASWEYTVAVVGVGYRGESGGFHVLVDLDWSAPKIDSDGYIDVGPLKQLELPGPLRDVDIGGDFRVGGFSAGANLKLFTFAGHAAGAEADLFVSQDFSSFSLGLAYHGKVRGLMADQSAALEIGFQPTDSTRLTLIGGVRVLSSYMPEIRGGASKELGRDFGGSFGGSRSEADWSYDYGGSYGGSARGRGSVTASQDETLRHQITYAPGLRVDLLSSGVSIEGGPILDHRGKVVGGRGGAAWEVIPDRMELGGSVSSIEGVGTAGAVTLGVSF